MLSHYRIFYHLSSVCCQWTFESSPQRPWWTIWTDTLQKHYSIQADIEWLLMAVIVPIFFGVKVSCCSIFSFLCNILWTIVFFFLPLYCQSFELRILITPMVFSSFSWYNMGKFQICNYFSSNFNAVFCKMILMGYWCVSKWGLKGQKISTFWRYMYIEFLFFIQF
jgi:hypothetical protein